MKFFKLGLRFWITLGSVFSFLFGWAVLGHSLKPFQPVKVEVTPLPALEPLPSFMGGNTFTVQQSQPQFSIRRQRPMFVTGGS